MINGIINSLYLQNMIMYGIKSIEAVIWYSNWFIIFTPIKVKHFYAPRIEFGGSSVTHSVCLSVTLWQENL